MTLRKRLNLCLLLLYEFSHVVGEPEWDLGVEYPCCVTSNINPYLTLHAQQNFKIQYDLYK